MIFVTVNQLNKHRCQKKRTKKYPPTKKKKTLNPVQQRLPTEQPDPQAEKAPTNHNSYPPGITFQRFPKPRASRNLSASVPLAKILTSTTAAAPAKNHPHACGKPNPPSHASACVLSAFIAARPRSYLWRFVHYPRGSAQVSSSCR